MTTTAHMHTHTQMPSFMLTVSLSLSQARTARESASAHIQGSKTASESPRPACAMPSASAPHCAQTQRGEAAEHQPRLVNRRSEDAGNNDTVHV